MLYMSESMNPNSNSISNTAYIDGYKITTSAIPIKTEEYIEIDAREELQIKQEENGKYSVFEIANWFLAKENMTQKKLQKLCYYAQAWCYALKGFRLANTDFQAWVHGPVSPVLYERFRSFGYDVIKMSGNYVSKIDVEDQRFLQDVWETYGDRTGNALEVLSHRELPWQEARRGYASDERCGVIISPITMATYYRSIYNGS